jgi:hypothetical protein
MAIRSCPSRGANDNLAARFTKRLAGWPSAADAHFRLRPDKMLRFWSTPYAERLMQSGFYNVTFVTALLPDGYFRQQKRRVLKHLRAAHDFGTASNAAKLVMLHWDDQEQFAEIKIHLTTSMIINYAKPFHDRGNDGPYGIRELKLSKYFDKKLHKTLLSLRHKLLAHADDESFPSQFMTSNIADPNNRRFQSTPMEVIAASYSFGCVDDRDLMRRLTDHIAACSANAHAAARLALAAYGEYSRLYDKIWCKQSETRTDFAVDRPIMKASESSFLANLTDDELNKALCVPPKELHRDGFMYRLLKIEYISSVAILRGLVRTRLRRMTDGTGIAAKFQLPFTSSSLRPYWALSHTIQR